LSEADAAENDFLHLTMLYGNIIQAR